MSALFITAVVLFVVAYALIISEKVHRTVVALAGAILMILFGVLNQEQALEGVDFNTLGLLIGMMVIVGIARHSGMFQYMAIWTSKVGKGKPVPIFVLLALLTAVLSALLDNVTTVMLIVPVVFVVANNLRLNPKPFLIGAILLSNIGGSATLIGDPPNILIGSAAGLSFNDFLIHMAPISFIVTLVTIAMLYWWYRKDLVMQPGTQESIMAFRPEEAITDKPLLWKSLFTIGLVLIGFFTHGVTHLEGATIALAGAALLLILTMHEPEEYLREVEWTTIFFFSGLFVLVTGLEHVGAIRMLAEQLIAATGGNVKFLTIALLWGSGIFSAVVDNIPFVATMIPLIKDIGAISGIALGPLWWVLALGADIGGNATIVGASANVVVSGMAGKEGHRIGFGEYMKVAIPMTVVGLLLCTVYVWMRYL